MYCIEKLLKKLALTETNKIWWTCFCSKHLKLCKISMMFIVLALKINTLLTFNLKINL